ncbi:hypothetical protein CEXT_809081 [Caerostris extrusa]|uniref:Uncharacterized protein n=1 Tax=Caerostris extrusa TaxID=172846 RepID=A0AAV4TZ01_CAEEX|nr:hypothetical protein CEXT_809081 [Caerostris extrusa]
MSLIICGGDHSEQKPFFPSPFFSSEGCVRKRNNSRAWKTHPRPSVIKMRIALLMARIDALVTLTSHSKSVRHERMANVRLVIKPGTVRVGYGAE